MTGVSLSAITLVKAGNETLKKLMNCLLIFNFVIY